MDTTGVTPCLIISISLFQFCLMSTPTRGLSSRRQGRGTPSRWPAGRRDSRATPTSTGHLSTASPPPTTTPRSRSSSRRARRTVGITIETLRGPFEDTRGLGVTPSCGDLTDQLYVHLVISTLFLQPAIVVPVNVCLPPPLCLAASLVNVKLITCNTLSIEKN